jgi:hypothetical protein
VSSQESNTEEDYRSVGLTPIPILLKLGFAFSIFKSQYQKDKFTSHYNQLILVRKAKFALLEWSFSVKSERNRREIRGYSKCKDQSVKGNA